EAESGMNIARIAALRAGLPDIVPGVTVNRFCSSGLQSIAMAAEKIGSGGGNKFAPNPWFVDHRPEVYMGMGLTAEQMQKKYGVSREDQDEFALRSHRNALRAQKEGSFSEEIVPVTVESTAPSNHGKQKQTSFIFDKDEGPRADTSLEALAKRQPVFQSDGTVTAGNSSQTSDGAAAALVMSESKAHRLGLKPMARFVSFAVGGVPPEIMGIGPVVAIPKALALAGMKLDD